MFFGARAEWSEANATAPSWKENGREARCLHLPQFAGSHAKASLGVAVTVGDDFGCRSANDSYAIPVDEQGLAHPDGTAIGKDASRNEKAGQGTIQADDPRARRRNDDDRVAGVNDNALSFGRLQLEGTRVGVVDLTDWAVACKTVGDAWTV